MTKSAESAAERIVGGGRLFAAGTQECFQLEMIGRAGGLRMTRALPASMVELRRGDVILYGGRNGLRSRELAQICRYRDRGAYVIAFASARSSELKFFRPDVLIDSGDEAGLPLGDGKICPTDTVVNVINGWAWTGEFIAACTRHGKLPGIQRSTNSAIKDIDDHKTAPVGAGVLGAAYLDGVEQSLEELESESVDALQIAGGWLREAGPWQSNLQAMGAMFPYHFKDPRSPQAFGAMGLFDKTVVCAPASFVTVLAQRSAPQLAIDAARLRRSRLLYVSAERAHDDESPNILYVDPHCPAGDLCVTIPPGAAKALPMSGVMQAAIYWSVVAEASAAGGAGAGSPQPQIIVARR